MSRTTTDIRGKKYPKSKKTSRYSIPKDAPKEGKGRKFLGFTDGTHSQFEPTKEKTYPVKGKDFIKYGYGRGVKKENKTKHYKKEIE